MTDPYAIAAALKALAASHPSVRDARIGLNALTITPAVEIWMRDGTTTTQRAAPTQQLLEQHELEIHIYSALRANQDADEALLAQIATELVNTIHSPSFDTTLGGLVETTRATRYGWDVIERNGHAFRAVLIEVQAGEL